MTEQDAKNKICPISLIPVSGGDDSPAFISPNSCIGSACMAWRATKGDEEPLMEAIRRYRNQHGATFKDAKEFVESHPEYRKGTPDGGYCGLAGKP